MLLTFMNFVLLGLTLAIPVGTLTIEMIKKGLKNGFWHSWTVGIGGLLADVIFITLIYAGAAQFLLQPTPKIIIWLLGILTLFYLGIDSVRSGFRPVIVTQDLKQSTIGHCFMAGFVTSLFNPMNIVFWLGVYGSVLASIMSRVPFKETLLYSSGVFLGVALWDILVSSTIHFSRKCFTPKAIRVLSIIAGFGLIGYGIHFGFEIVELIYK